MKKKNWNILVPMVQLLMVLFIGVSAYSAGYETVDWKFIPMIFILNFVIVDIMLYRYTVGKSDWRQKQLENEALATELEEQIAHYDKVIERLDVMSKFRHDFRNYMQTVYGLIEMKAYAEAEDMLRVLSEKIEKDRAFKTEI